MTSITLDSWRAWHTFARDNRAAIAEEHGTAAEALTRALDRDGLAMGGGAGPLFVVRLELAR